MDARSWAYTKKMTMENRHSRVCILGGGPTAMLSQIFLRKWGVDACIVAESALGSLRPMQIEDVRINPVPIFISQDTDLFRRMEYEPHSEASYVKSSHSEMSADGVTDDIKPGSYADFITQTYPDAARRLILTKKHVGTDAFRLHLPGLRRKVVAHYPPGHPSTKRIGFNDGESLYLSYLEREQFQAPLKGTVRSVDIEKKCVITESHRITFDRLISTLPFLDFLFLAGIQTSLKAVGAGAQIVVLRTRQTMIPNRLIYDCDVASPLYRVFTPSESFIIAQVAQPLWGIGDGAVAKRVQELFNLTDLPGVMKRFTVQDCYPLEISDYTLKNAIISDLERSGVILFGRFAEWEYHDLEQLNWERIGCLS